MTADAFRTHGKTQVLVVSGQDVPDAPGKVGIFWRCHDQWWMHASAVGEIKPDSLGYVDDPTGHYEYWQRLQSSHPELRNIEYDDSLRAPRGRIIYDSTRSEFIVYMARRLHSASLKIQLSTAFDLPLSQTRFATDEHYE